LPTQRARKCLTCNTAEVVVPEGRKWTRPLINKLDFASISVKNGFCSDSNKNRKAEEVFYVSNDLIGKLEDKLDKEIDKVVRGDELKPGVLQYVKVYVAKKRKLSVGDKMAGPSRQQGRHLENRPRRKTCRFCPTGPRST